MGDQTLVHDAAWTAAVPHVRAVQEKGGKRMSDEGPDYDPEWDLDNVRPVTKNLVEAIMLDVWPRTAAVIDFGLDSRRHYEALYYPVREGEITPRQLDVALGKGPELTQLVRAAPSNPHKDIEFVTSWDVLPRRTQRDTPAPSPAPRKKRDRNIDLDR
jgi:hypothetical protein